MSDTVQTLQFSMSPSIGKLAEALAKAQLEITGAVKDSSNPFFKSKYADLSAVLEAGKPCNAHGLALIQIPLEAESGVRLVTTLAHSSGEWMQGVYKMTPTKNDPQGIGSCLTYMRRYAAAAFLGIAQIDDDANEASNKSPDARQNSHKILPSTEAVESIVGGPREASLRLVAEKITDHMAEADIVNAAAIYTAPENIKSQEEKIFVWSLLSAEDKKVLKAYLDANKPQSVNAAQKAQALRDAVAK
jgi:ERF superfamily